ncbi:MAG: FimB/Mfa2 family fimbrial subunit, partial [Bacteroides sp.]
MKKIFYSIGLFASLTLSCMLLASCIQDEIQTCQYRIRLKYDYNMDYLDKFLVQAQKLSLLIFDQDQRLYQLVKLEGNPLLQQRELAIDLPTALTGQEFTFLAWVGLDESYFELTALQVGTTTRQEVEVALKTNTAFSTAQIFQAFMQGSLSTPVEPNQVYEIPLIKN